jgi:glycosyltransferase involved in cell wall biosynthesis
MVVPCRNEGGQIQAVLRSILAQREPAGGFEIVLADGGSTDGTREILQKAARTDPRIRMVDNPKRIVPTGLNAAIRAAHGEIILRMDAHTEYAPDYVLRCVEVLEQTGAANVGGPARTKADTCMGRAIAAAYHSSFSVGGARFHDPNYEGYVDTVTYGCWPRSTFEKFGLFDEEFVRNQDDEHNLRINRGGGKVYQSPKIKSWYRPRGSLRALFNQYMQYGYWKVRVIQKHKLPASWRHLVPGTFVLTLATLLMLSAFGAVRSTLAPHPQIPALGTQIFIYGFSPSGFSLSLLAVLGTYISAVFVASVFTAAKTEWKLLPLLPMVFACYHLGYGVGFLRGVWSFVVRRNNPGEWAARLTRGK